MAPKRDRRLRDLHGGGRGKTPNRKTEVCLSLSGGKSSLWGEKEKGQASIKKRGGGGASLTRSQRKKFSNQAGGRIGKGKRNSLYRRGAEERK